MNEYQAQLEEIFISANDLLSDRSYDYCYDKDFGVVLEDEDGAETEYGIRFRGSKIADTYFACPKHRWSRGYKYIRYTIYQTQNHFVGIKAFELDPYSSGENPNYDIDICSKKNGIDGLRDFFEYDADNEDIEEEEILAYWFGFSEKTIHSLRTAASKKEKNDILNHTYMFDADNYEENTINELEEDLAAARNVIEWLADQIYGEGHE